MLVETYEVTEMDADCNTESDAEAVGLIDKLGLEGQQKLLNPDTGTRTPYRKMTADEKFVYELICPKKTKLKDFSDSAIPVRVLQVAAHAVELFDNVWVWSATDADIKDPVLVGTNGSEFSSSKEFFILARWGEELAPLSELMTAACRKHRDALLVEGRRIVSKATAFVESVSQATGTEVREIKTPSYFD